MNKKFRFSTHAGTILLTILILFQILSACRLKGRTETSSISGQYDPVALATLLEVSLTNYILEPWYPRIIDTIYGGYHSSFNHNWSPTTGFREKALVQQARHLWTTSYILENHPERKEYLNYAAQGFEFIKDHFWDTNHGGFHYACNEDGTRDGNSIRDKRTYGQAFAIYGLSKYYAVSKDPAALELAIKEFLWMEEHIHDSIYGGYIDVLNADGTPKLQDPDEKPGTEAQPSIGLKDYNSSIHIMEAFTELYHVWPDSLVRTRLEEMFYLIRDTFVHPDGFLQLYFYPDWTLVPDHTMDQLSGGNHWFTQHFTYGHDVETAYLLLETAHILGWGEDHKTHWIAKRLVDHSLESGWDKEIGGFYDAGKERDGEIRIINEQKSWWSQIEGLNALVLMHTLFPEDPNDYYEMAVQMWKYIDNYLIDKEYGGWYNFGLDMTPNSKTERKSHAWKTTYHNVRGMENCIRMLQGE